MVLSPVRRGLVRAPSRNRKTPLPDVDTSEEPPDNGQTVGQVLPPEGVSSRVLPPGPKVTGDTVSGTGSLPDPRTSPDSPRVQRRSVGSKEDHGSRRTPGRLIESTGPSSVPVQPQSIVTQQCFPSSSSRQKKESLDTSRVDSDEKLHTP